MIIMNNESLKKYTTIKIGGIAKNLYIPETVDELIQTSVENKNYKVISGGSNLLINDEKTFDNVILLTHFNNNIKLLENNTVYCGGSVRIQKLIKELHENNLGGLEYLYSVPGRVGSLTRMNGGTGITEKKYISDYIISVDYLVDGEIRTLNKQDCNFSHRNSIFKNINAIIVGVLFKFEYQDKNESKKRIESRLQQVKGVQENTKPTFGSVFSHSNEYIMRLVRKMGLGYKNGVQFSKLTYNWMINNGNGSFRQAIKLIKIVKILHIILLQKSKLEVEIWN